MIDRPIKISVLDRSGTDLSTDDVGMIQEFVRANESRNDVMFVEHPGDADLIVLFEGFSFKQFDYVERLLLDSCVQRWAEKLFVVNYDDSVRQGFLPGCYVSVPQTCFDPEQHRACAYPKVYNEYLQPQEAGRTEGSPVLFSFSGVLSSHPIRERIFAMLSSHPKGSIREVKQGFHTHDEEQKKRYVEEIKNSLFVLCPRGHSPATYRLFEVMQMGRCPIIISDDWVEPQGIAWGEFSFRVSECQIERIPELLTENMGRAVAMGAIAREIWRTHFSEEKNAVLSLNSLIELQSLRAERGSNFSLEEYRAYWSSREFLKKNGWTFSQKVLRRLQKVFRLLEHDSGQNA